MSIIHLYLTHFWPMALVTLLIVVAACVVLIGLMAALSTLFTSHRLQPRWRYRRRRHRRYRWFCRSRYLRIRRKPRRYPNDPGRPAHLRALIITEHDLRIDRPVPLMGRPDEVYRDEWGALVPVDTKTRKRAAVYTSDCIQLSAYGVLLAYARHRLLPRILVPGRKRRVATYGYIRCVTPSGTRWRRVDLMTEAEVIRLTKRRVALEQGRLTPNPTAKAWLCRRCAYRSQCPFSQGR